MIKLIIFDLDGVLVDAKEIHYNAFVIQKNAMKYLIENEISTWKKILKKLLTSLQNDNNPI